MPFLASRALFVALLCWGCTSGIASQASTSARAPQPSERPSAHPQVVSGLAAVVERWFPAVKANAACSDTPLRLAFRAPVALGKAGKLRLIDSATGKVTAELDVAAARTTTEISGRVFQRPSPIAVDGDEVIVDLPRHALEPGKTYSVAIESGVFVDASGAPLAALEPGTWTFSVRKPEPRAADHLVVAQDDSGDFCSVQGAVDAVSDAQRGRVTIDVKNGVYRELVFISHKPALTLRGEDRAHTVIRAENNDALQNKLGSKFRALVNVESSDDFVLENLTLENSTPQGGSQAEALRVDASERVILRRADFKSRQDTLQLSGRVYAHDCYVEGNVDYVWGKGTAYFERCEFHAIGRSGYDVQARNDDNYGYVFVDSKLTAEPGLSGHVLARIEADRFPKSQVAYVGCQLGPHIAPGGWLVTSGTDTSKLRFWEYQSTDPSGKALDTSQRNPVSRQLSQTEALALRDKASVLGGWNPNE